MLIIYIFSFVMCLDSEAQHNMIFRFKAEALGGMDICPEVEYGKAAGGEVACELPLYGNKKWHYTYNFPSVGFALGYLNFLENESPQHMAFTYPYFLYPVIHNPRMALNVRLGAGFGAWVDNKFRTIWYNSTTYFPAYFVSAVGLTCDINLATHYGNPLAQWMITFGANELLFHDFYVDRRTMVLSVPNVNLGVKYTPNVYPLPMKHKLHNFNRCSQLEIGLAGGVNQLDRGDHNNYFIDANLNGYLYYPFTRAYRMGGGLDVFFNDAYDGTRHDIKTRYNFIDEDKFKNRMRGGIVWANELTIERFAIGLHVGGYVFNPIKVPKSFEGEKLPCRSENFVYFKLMTKYHITKRLFCMAEVKSHMDRVEYVQMGLGWSMLDFGDRVKNPFSRISFKKEDENELKVEGVTNTKKPFRFRETGDQ